MTGHIRRFVGTHLPGYRIGTVAPIGEGLDHTAFDVNGEMIVRLSKEEDAGTRAERVRREAQLLGVVARYSTLPVPEVVFVDPDAGALAYRKLAGVPLHGVEHAAPASLAPVLGRFASSVHRVPLSIVEDLVERDPWPMSDWLQGAQRDYLRMASSVPPARRQAIDVFLGSTPPPEATRFVFCHNDLGAEHVLVDDGGQITGVIDWSDAAITDPARDLAMILRDFGPASFDAALVHYECPFDEADRDRALFLARCKVLEDIAYGLESGVSLYAENGIAHLEWLFA